MNDFHRVSRRRNVSGSSRPKTDIPDNYGNRKLHEEVIVPIDNVGNYCDGYFAEDNVPDSVGNSVDLEPTHLKSGVLSRLEASRQPKMVRRSRDSQRSERKIRSLDKTMAKAAQNKSMHQTTPEQALDIDAEDFMETLSREFAHLINKKLGSPFTFSMTPFDERSFDGEVHLSNLERLESLLSTILDMNEIDAEIMCSQYEKKGHRFAVFFIEPSEKDALKNKQVISALRQVIETKARALLSKNINIFLVLANAKKVIEDHLEKIGASKI